MDTIINIPISGLNISQSEKSVPDGASEDIINLRLKNGKWQPASYKKNFDSTTFSATIATTDSVYKHEITPDDTYIVWENISVRYVNNTSVLGVLVLLGANELVWNVTSLDKSLIVTTNFDKYIFVFDDGYTELTDLPPIDYIEFGEATGTRRSDATYDDVSACTNADTYWDAYQLLLPLQTKARLDGYYQGHLLIRVGYKLFDGSVHRISEPFYVKLGQDNTHLWGMFYRQSVNSPNGWFFNQVHSNYPTYFIKLTAALYSIFNAYNGIVTDLVIYATVPVEAYDVESTTDLTSDIGYPKLTDINDLLKNKQDYYQVAEWDIAEYIQFVEDGGSQITNITKQLKLPSIDTFPTNPSMPIGETYHNYLGQSNFIYNERVHYSNLTKKFFEGHNPFAVSVFYLSSFVDAAMDGFVYDRTSASFVVYYYIKTENSNIITLKSDPIAYVYTKAANPDRIMLKSFPFYPNIGCEKIEIYIKGTGTDIELIKTIFTGDLEKQSVSAKQGIVLEVESTNGTVTLEPQTNRVVFESFELPSFSSADTIPTESDKIVKPNQITVSDISNPLYFPYDQFYSFGLPETIVYAMATAIFEMSTAQFGQYPLYVFTDDGVYVMQQGVGEVLYVNINKASRAIIDDKDIVVVRDGIVFKTKDGLTLIRGKETVNISSILEGYNYANVPVVNTAKNAANFLYYLGAAILAYDFKENELWVTNNNYNYSYIYQITSGIWTKRDETFDFFTIQGNTYTGYKGNIFKDLSEEEATPDGMAFAVVTRPIKLSGSKFVKKISRIICEITGELIATETITMKIYGSNDTDNWQLMRYSSQATLPINDLTVKRLNGSMKYLIIVVEGTIQELTGELSGFTVDYTNKYKNRIR